MYTKDLKVGARVVPVIKTIEGPLSKSKEWAAAQEAKQAFLYIVKVDAKPGRKPIILCAVSKTAKTGDRFATIDLRAYPWNGWDCRKPGAKKVVKPAAKKVVKPAAKKAAKPAAKKAAKPAVKKEAPKPRKQLEPVMPSDDLPPVEVAFP